MYYIFRMLKNTVKMTLQTAPTLEEAINFCEYLNRADGVLGRYFPIHRDELHLFGVTWQNANS